MDNLLGEFMGTLVLIVFGCGVNANMALKKTCGNGGGWICTTTGWAFAVLLGVYTSVALGAPQGDLIPSVTLAKTLALLVITSPISPFPLVTALARLPSR